ncbi:aminopeptidase P family protein [Micromonospora sp. HNM0581]|uniref:M24 family metallopeptidase n=1 Tax=Micromonospora sp. HNM0581 TaxID=2716341 RepID=UPI00146C7E36|nr:Xaa-Pro peptidase family protein [Micromonospora sp. HNM0581]NLU78496.1 aminopeptidase P family protein [Micromonospora sp. HNM0581]
MTDEPTRTVPVHVYQDRIARIRRECAEQGLAGLLLVDQASLFYLFGYDQIGYWVFQVVYLPAEQALPPGAICRAPDEHMIRGTGLIDDVRVWYDESPRTPGQLVADLLRDRQVPSGARVGIELFSHALLPGYHEDLRRYLDGRIVLTDASRVVGDLRVIKDDHEIAWFRQAAHQLDAAFRVTGNVVGAGVPETEVHRAIVDELYRLGGDPPAIPPPIASGPRTLTQTHGAATTRRIRAGESVVVEIGAASNRYHAVGAFSYCLGPPDPSVAHLHDVMVESLEAGFAAFVPGQPIAEVSRLVQSQLTTRGVSRAGRHVGYGTGVGFPPTWLENLRIKVTESRVFAPGMTFFYFIGLPGPDGGSLYIGEPVLITPTGHERVAPLDYENWIR